MSRSFTGVMPPGSSETLRFSAVRTRSLRDHEPGPGLNRARARAGPGRGTGRRPAAATASLASPAPRPQLTPQKPHPRTIAVAAPHPCPVAVAAPHPGTTATNQCGSQDDSAGPLLSRHPHPQRQQRRRRCRGVRSAGRDAGPGAGDNAGTRPLLFTTSFVPSTSAAGGLTAQRCSCIVQTNRKVSY